jgi:hypothetical protein
MRITDFHINASAPLLVLVVLLAISSTYGAVLKSYPSCETKTTTGTFCTIAVNDLRPTQFGVGMDEVNCKKQRFESMTNSDLQNYLLKYAQRAGTKDAVWPFSFPAPIFNIPNWIYMPLFIF